MQKYRMWNSKNRKNRYCEVLFPIAFYLNIYSKLRFIRIF